MLYVSRKQYHTWLKNRIDREIFDLELVPEGYIILNELNSMGVLYHKPFLPVEESFDIQFVVVFRSVKSNLVAVKNDSYLVPITLEEPIGATFDDLVLLHGKKFIDDYVQSPNIAEIIPHTHIQPWGVVQIENTLFVPIEIIVEDEVLQSGDCALNGDFTNDDRDKSEVKLLNGFAPITEVKKYLVQEYCKCLEHKLREVK